MHGGKKNFDASKIWLSWILLVCALKYLGACMDDNKAKNNQYRVKQERVGGLSSVEYQSKTRVKKWSARYETRKSGGAC